MPLARFAIYALGVEVYIAPTYDAGDKWIGTLQHIAREGGCWVVGSGVAFRANKSTRAGRIRDLAMNGRMENDGLEHLVFSSTRVADAMRSVALRGQ